MAARGTLCVLTRVLLRAALCLRNNELTDSGIASLLEGLANHDQLFVIDVRNNTLARASADCRWCGLWMWLSAWLLSCLRLTLLTFMLCLPRGSAGGHLAARGRVR